MKNLLFHAAIAAFFSALVFLNTGCGGNAYSPAEYKQWINEHRAALTTQISHSDLIYSLTYLPADWLALNEADASNPAAFSKTREEYAGLEYYRLRIALNSAQGDVLQYGAESQEAYYQRVEYFSFGLQNDLHLINGQDTLPCKLFHFERNYGAAPFADFMIGFEERQGNKSDRTLIYEERVYLQQRIQLTIPAQNIQQVPNLKL